MELIDIFLKVGDQGFHDLVELASVGVLRSRVGKVLEETCLQAYLEALVLIIIHEVEADRVKEGGVSHSESPVTSKLIEHLNDLGGHLLRLGVPNFLIESLN